MKKIPVDGVIFDLDGTIYIGDQALPGAVETIAELRHRGKGTFFISNNTLEHRRVYADKLTSLGIPTGEADVITPTEVLGSYLTKNSPGLRLYVIGEENLGCELRGYGLTVVDELWNQDERQVITPDGIEAVVVASDRTLTYRKLNTAYQALVRGARFFAANSDVSYPVPNGAIPDAGAVIAALEHITGRKLELLAGKPSPLILQAALEHLALPAQSCLMVGDRLETDIRMGREAGMPTALVLTGITRREDLANSPDQPDFVLDSLFDLLSFL